MMSIHKRNVLAIAIACAVAAPAAQADQLYQPFNIGVNQPPGCHTGELPGGPGTYPYPSDWLFFNVDGRTPDAAVAYVNDAWEVREDFAFDVSQCAAFSTSWYSPAGQADDWTWSPALAIPASGSVLSWRAVAYDPNNRDGYEVRVKADAVPTLANQTSSDIVFSTPAEESSWTHHTIDLSAYAGHSVYVGFRNNSTDKFLLLIDDVRVFGSDPDLAATAPVPPYASEYARAPLGMDIEPSLAVMAMNVGGQQLTNITAIALPQLDGSAAGAAVPSDAPVASLALGASAPVTFGAPAAYSGAGAWTTKYTLFSDQTSSDIDPANDSIEIPGTTIGGNEFARWEGAGSGMLGIGAGNGGELGVELTIPTDGWYAGAHFGIAAIPPDDGTDPPVANICPGFAYVVNLRAFDTVNSVPGGIIDSTEAVPCEYDIAYSVDAPFTHGARFLTAGTYVLTAVEVAGGPTLQLVLHNDRFVEGTTWVDWPTNSFGDWAHFENFGASFAKAPELSLLSGEPELPIFVDGFDGVVPRPAMLQRMYHALSPLSHRPLRKPAPTRIVAPADH
jgi:1,2-phenylacetyl-CoA epoxidase PaaB subunit